ncbi:hypothetical protein, partial [uncultured Bifidobacterium sp.]|uniref:hypothetical protein n=1 Tax=uncultured Bifidobacterium sp. TaxID=165187 RepID=UPI002593D63B
FMKEDLFFSSLMFGGKFLGGSRILERFTPACGGRTGFGGAGRCGGMGVPDIFGFLPLQDALCAGMSLRCTLMHGARPHRPV